MIFHMEPTPPSPHDAGPRRKKLNPLAVVLIVSGAFTFLLFVVSVFAMLAGSFGGGERSVSRTANLFRGNSVAVLELSGVITDSKKILKQLESFAEDSDVKAVVLRLNSPGGSVAPSQEIYQAVRKFKKPLIVSMGSVAASGAYYIACGAKKIFANAGTITGSIGVIMEFANLSKLYEWAKVQRYSIKTGKYKDAGADYRDMTADERALLQGMVDDVLLQFKQAVSKGRKLTLQQVTAIADGRIFSGVQAQNVNLVDEIGTLQDAIDEAAKMAGISGKPSVVYPEKAKHRWLDLLLDNGGGGDDSDSSESRISLSPLGPLTRALREALGQMDPLARLAPGVYWLWNGAN